MERTAMGDYSLLINSIEGNLAKYTSKDSSFEVPSVSVRKRNHLEQTPEQPINTENIISTAKKIRMNAESDELRLMNEQLTNRLETITDEYDRMKDKMYRQVTFLDKENDELRNSLNKANEKYFDEKKTWQSKVRTLESEVVSLQKQMKQLESSQTTTQKKSEISISTTRSQNDELLSVQSLAIFETKIKQKVEEVKKLTILNAELEGKVSSLENEILLMKATTMSTERGVISTTIGQKSGSFSVVKHISDENNLGGSENTTQIIKQLERKCDDLEMKLRIKTREYDKYVKKLENQTVLEDELMTIKNKLVYTQNQVNEYIQYESKYHILKQEKESWYQQFQQLIHQSKQSLASTTTSTSSTTDMTSVSTMSTSNNVTVEEITPVQIYKFVHQLQQKVMILLENESKLTIQNKQLTQKLNTLEIQHDTQKQTLSTLEKDHSELQSKYSLLVNQKDLYMKEIQTLRQLMTTYDAELKVGVKIDYKMNLLIKGKDDMLLSLRTQLDQCRTQIDTEYIPRINTLNDEINTLKLQNESLTHKETRSDISKKSTTTTTSSVLDKYNAENLDFDPETTKVLHIIQNPSTIFHKNLQSSTTTTTTNSNMIYDSMLITPRDQFINSTSNTSGSTGNSYITPMSGNGGGGGVGHTSLMSDTSNDSQHHIPATSTSTSLLIDSNKMNQRLKEMFKERISAFREAVYLLTGYKIDLIASDTNNSASSNDKKQSPSTTLRLRSMYAEHPDDCLVFQLRGSNLELLDTPFASKLDSKIFVHLTTCHSVPCFLSTITMQLFDNQTFLG